MSELSTVKSREGSSLTLVCSGFAETETLKQLTSVVDEVHGDAMEHSEREVVADVRHLQFASSTCLKVFVAWMQRVMDLEDGRRYKVRFRANWQHSWQRRTLGMLAAFAGDIVTIDADS